MGAYDHAFRPDAGTETIERKWQRRKKAFPSRQIFQKEESRLRFTGFSGMKTVTATTLTPSSKEYTWTITEMRFQRTETETGYSRANRIPQRSRQTRLTRLIRLNLPTPPNQQILPQKVRKAETKYIKKETERKMFGLFFNI